VRRVRRSRAPAVLIDADGPGARERAEALAHYGKPASRKKTFKSFKVYKHQDVKDALNQAFHFKCAYCESSYEGTAPMDVEHYRPKAAVLNAEGELLKPGYYWLASDWENLLPSCTDCNRARAHEHADRDPEVSGKANLFPIANDHRTNLDPGAERGERRLLADPCRDQVADLFRFHFDRGLGVVVEPTPGRGLRRRRAESSIRVCGLNRVGLANRRATQRQHLLSRTQLVEKCLEQLVDRPRDESCQRDVMEAVRQLRSLTDEMADYAGMASQLLAPVFESIDAKLGEILGNALDDQPGATPLERLDAKFPPAEEGDEDGGDDGGLADLIR